MTASHLSFERRAMENCWSNTGHSIKESRQLRSPRRAGAPCSDQPTWRVTREAPMLYHCVSGELCMNGWTVSPLSIIAFFVAWRIKSKGLQLTFEAFLEWNPISICLSVLVSYCSFLCVGGGFNSKPAYLHGGLCSRSTLCSGYSLCLGSFS